MFKQFLLAISLAISSLCSANTVVFNNFIQPYNYDRFGYIIGGPTSANYFDEFAMSFTPSSTGYLSDVHLAFSIPSSLGSEGDGFNLWLSTDSNGLPAAQETSISFNVSTSTETLFGNDVIHLTSNDSYLLDKNKKYWIGIESQQIGYSGVWWTSLLSKSTDVAERNLLQSDQWAIETADFSSAFSVSVSHVPLPPSYLLLISGFLPLLLKRKNA